MVHDTFRATPLATRYPIGASARVCGRNPGPQGLACLGNLTASGVEDAAAGLLCGRNPSQEAQQCLARLKILGMGVVPDFTAARMCAVNPNTQPYDASRIAACMTTSPTGQMGYNGAGATPDDDYVYPTTPKLDSGAAPANQ